MLHPWRTTPSSRALLALLLLSLGACNTERPSPGRSASTAQSDNPVEDPVPQDLNLSLAGLWTNVNQLGQQPPAGSLIQADNITIDTPGVGTPVRGMGAVGYDVPADERITSFFDYDGQAFAMTDTAIYRDTGTAYVAVTGGTLDAPTGALVKRTMAAGGDLFVTSSAGVKVMDGASSDLKSPGVFQALDVFGVATTTGTAVPAESSVGYRVVIGVNDAEGRPVLSAPSGRVVHTTTSGTSKASVLQVPLPSGLSTSHYIQVYRTSAISAPGGIAVDPGDSMAQVAEHVLTSSEIAAGYVEITDSQPDTLRGTPLYTNASLGGIAAQSNAQPPVATDVAVYRDCLFLANTAAAQSITIRMLGTPDTDDTITIAGVTYTAKYTTTEDFLDMGDAGIFLWWDDGSVSQNIEQTARSLVWAINTRTGNSVYAYYLSGDNDPPGMIRLVSRDVAGPAFSVQSASAGDLFIPSLLLSTSSHADVRKNRLHYSKQNLPYAFPLANTLPVGAEEKPIVRIAALRDSLYVFKEGDGVWVVTGQGPGAFSVRQVHQTLSLAAPESLAVVDNTIYALSTSGVVEVSDLGVEFIDPPIGNIITNKLLTLPDAVRTKAFGVGNEAEAKYMLYLPEDASSESGATEAYVWNITTQTWTRRLDGNVVSGAVDQHGKLRLGLFEEPTAKVERRSGVAQEDYLGLELEGLDVISAAPSDSAATTLTLDGDHAVAVGSVVRGEDGQVARVTGGNGTDAARSIVYLDKPILVDFMSYPALIRQFEPIPIAVGWPVNDAGNPAAMKQFTEACVLTEQSHSGEWTFSFRNDLSPDPSYTTCEAENTPYCRVWVPDDVQKTTRLYTVVERDVAGEELDILGLQTHVRIFGGAATSSRLAR